MVFKPFQKQTPQAGLLQWTRREGDHAHQAYHDPE